MVTNSQDKVFQSSLAAENLVSCENLAKAQRVRLKLRFEGVEQCVISSAGNFQAPERNLKKRIYSASVVALPGKMQLLTVLFVEENVIVFRAPELISASAARVTA